MGDIFAGIQQAYYLIDAALQRADRLLQSVYSKTVFVIMLRCLVSFAMVMTASCEPTMWMCYSFV